MTDRRSFLFRLAALGAAAPLRAFGPNTAARHVASPEARDAWVQLALRLADPVLGALADGALRRTMPVELSAAANPERRDYAHLEAVGRLLAGIAPWLELATDGTPEGDHRVRLAERARQGLHHATDPRSPDYLNFTTGRQPLVDAAFLAQAIVRAPRALWASLDPATQRQLGDALRSTRPIQPGQNNWLLFSAMIEAALYRMGEPWDRSRIDYALRQHEQWYKGDGAYGDGPSFHWDYYNSFVIHPMLIDVLSAVAPAADEWHGLETEVRTRARRYAAVQERLVGPDGTFPPIGRSLAYRCGAFHLLAQAALRRDLPEGVSPAQVRGALSAVIHRTLDVPGTFDERGWLTVGFAGHQPRIGESYISSGSSYLCAVALLPLGLPAHDVFWTAPIADWTAKALWGGRDLPPDHAI
ncbi:MAG: DUF2264 domain-containing protein [Gemmatimonadaceae bacterium]